MTLSHVIAIQRLAKSLLAIIISKSDLDDFKVKNLSMTCNILLYVGTRIVTEIPLRSPRMKKFGGTDMLCYDWHKIMEMA